MTPKTRKQLIQNLFPKEKSFRLKQIETALFQPEIMSWDQLSTLPLSMRQTLIKEIGFISVQIEKIFETADKETFKAILKLDDGQSIESVLMQNKRGHWTVCVSTQIGCAMGCSFCATGKMGLKRNLNSDEIIDQYRFWQKFLADHAEFDQQITNLVYMGMGEPLANYEEVKDSLNRILANTEIGPTRITVSTVGVLPRLQQILTDDEWPAVKIAISLHSADTEIRQSIMRS
ncbi:radical SAM protein, partial [Patescibacteria group bacterium]|nr:radical SAM protein [Patescibacteria group bacterium]